MAGTQAPPTLFTIPLSHYCEKARWGLERYSVPFSEEPHAPGFHRAAAKAAGGRGSVPVLRLPPGSGSGGAGAAGCVDESTPILRWVDTQAAIAAAAAAAGGQGQAQENQREVLPPLFPPGPEGQEVERLCREFDSQLGPAARRWVYFHLLYNPGMGGVITAPPVPAWERAVLRWGGWLLLRPLMAWGMGINAAGAERVLGKIRRSFDEVAARLAGGQPYLVGEHFTAADLSFAALAAPALGQPYGTAPGLDADTPLAMREVVEELRAHPAGAFALRLWESERGRQGALRRQE